MYNDYQLKVCFDLARGPGRDEGNNWLMEFAAHAAPATTTIYRSTAVAMAAVMAMVQEIAEAAGIESPFRPGMTGLDPAMPGIAHDAYDGIVTAVEAAFGDLDDALDNASADADMRRRWIDSDGPGVDGFRAQFPVDEDGAIRVVDRTNRLTIYPELSIVEGDWGEVMWSAEAGLNIALIDASDAEAVDAAGLYARVISG